VCFRPIAGTGGVSGYPVRQAVAGKLAMVVPLPSHGARTSGGFSFVLAAGSRLHIRKYRDM
jgi:hypothetical protein